MKRNLPIVDRQVAVPHGVMLVSKTDLAGIIRYANDAFVSISGFEREELIGHSHNIVRHPDMPPEVFADMWATLKSGEPWRGTVKNRRRDGAYYWVDACIVPIRQHDKTVGYMSVRQAASGQAIARACQTGPAVSQSWQQRLLARLGIRKGFYLGSFFVALSMLAGGVLGVGGLYMADQSVRQLTRQHVVPLEVVARMSRTLADTHRALTVLRYDVSGAVPPSESGQRRRELQQGAEAISADLKQLMTLPVGPGQKIQTEQLRTTLQQLQQTGLQPADRALASRNWRELDQLLGDSLLPLAARAERQLETLGVALAETARQEEQDAIARNDLIRFLAIVGIAISLLAVVRVGRLYLANIIDPLNEAINRFDRIAQGNLSGEINLGGVGETGRLNRATATMQLHLKVMLDEISLMARQIDTQCLRLKDILWLVVEHSETQHDQVCQANEALMQMADEVNRLGQGMLSLSEPEGGGGGNTGWPDLDAGIRLAALGAAEAEACVREVAARIVDNREAVQSAWHASEALESTSRELKRLVSRFALVAPHEPESAVSVPPSHVEAGSL